MKTWVAGLPCILSTACFGTTFDLDERLSATAPLSITGTLGANHTQYCDSKNRRATEGFPADKEAPIEIGSLSGLASAPHREITTTPLFSEAVTRDYERFLGKVRDHEAGRLAGALLALLGVGDVTRPAAAGEDSHDAAHFVMTLPGEAKEVMTFTFFATRKGRAISAACSSTDVARFWGAFDGPHFSMRCLIVPSADRIPRELRASGEGSWALFAYKGELQSRGHPAERAAVQSLEVGMLGAGVISGFEIKNQTGQLAAVSFYEIVNEPGRAKSLAWELPQLSPGWSDTILATLAIAYVFPWPTACDARHLAGKADQ